MTTTANDPAEIQDYIDRGLKHLWLQTQQINDLRKDDGMVVIEEGEGIYLSDTHGQKYIDAMSGLWVVAVGHGRTELADVAREQMKYGVAELSTHDNQRVTKALNDNLQAALSGTKTPEAALKDAQREAERILRAYGR